MGKRAEYNVGVNISKMVDDLPAGLDRAMLKVLSYHVGRSLAISRGELVIALKSHGFDIHERAMRAAINQLRKDGHPICSTGGDEGGYWLGESFLEVKEYIDHELNSRISDLAETKAGMMRGAQERWGEGIQEKFF